MVSKQNTLNTREMPKRTCPKGYYAKIAYHLLNNNTDSAHYFTRRQVEVYGRVDKQELVEEMVKIMTNNAAVVQNIAEHLADYVGEVAQNA